MVTKSISLTCASVVLALLALLANRVSAHIAQSAHCESKVSLNQFLSQAAESRQLCFVVEGAAGERDLATEIAAPSVDLPLDKAIENVAVQADMKVERVGKVFLLTRRYHKQVSVPSISPLEWKQSLEDAATIIRPYAPSSADPEPYAAKRSLLRLFKMLTPQQVQKLDEGLSYSEMTAEQQQILMVAGADVFFTTAHWETIGANGILSAVFEKDAFFSVRANHPGQIVLNVPAGKPGSYFPYPLRFGNEAAPPMQNSEEISKHRFTLVQIVEMLNKRGATNYAVDTAFRDKLTYIYGDEKITPQQLAIVVSRLHGLRLRNDGSATHFARVRSFQSVGADAVPTAVAKCWPAALRRLWFLPPEGDTSSVDNLPGTGILPVTVASIGLPRSSRANTEAVLKIVDRLLFAGLEKRILASPDKKLPVSSLTPEEQQMLCQWLIPKLVVRVFVEQQKVPEYLSTPSRIVLKGNLSPVQEKDGSTTKHLSITMQTATSPESIKRRQLSQWFSLSFPVPSETSNP